MKSHNTRYTLRSFIGYHPFLLKITVGLLRGRWKRICHKNTTLVVEAFPRSANTYTVAVFHFIYNGNINIAHHAHAVGQFKLASTYKKPCILIIRHPYDAILSLAIRRPKVSCLLLINEYISFHTEVYKLSSTIAICTFEEVTDNANVMINRLNSKYNTHFKKYVKTESNEKSVFSIIENMEKHDSGGSIRETHIARPSENRKNSSLLRLKSEEIKKYADILTIADNIYKELVLESHR